MNRWNCSSLEGALKDLDLQDVSLAFLVLAGKVDPREIYPKLADLGPEEWEVLAHLLTKLEAEKLLSRVN
jgi:hypothetical protein